MRNTLRRKPQSTIDRLRGRMKETFSGLTGGQSHKGKSKVKPTRKRGSSQSTKSRAKRGSTQATKRRSKRAAR